MTRRQSISLDGPGWRIKGYLDEEWRMRRAFASDTRDVHGWLPARVPGSVLADLVRAGVVPDPRVGLNSRACEWVATRSWVYRREVAIECDDGPVELELDGIDYAARVFVNGVEVGTHQGAFTPGRFDVTEVVRDGTNLVAVVLAPAPPGESQLGDTSRVRTMKSRMTYGWDFCPRLVHIGLWDRARLSFPSLARIEDLFVRPMRDSNGGSWRLFWKLETRADREVSAVSTVELVREGHVVARDEHEVVLPAAAAVSEGELAVAEPELWWPNGYGPHPLYEVRATLVTPDGKDQAEVTTAFRSIELAADEPSPADSRRYTFVVNGRRVYIQGWNWVPMDVDHGVEDPDRLDHLLGLAARPDVNLLRVWGGGLIEKHAFYTACDRLGIMVWQEFPLSSSLLGSTPSADADYVATVVGDARQIVRRRRNHPSLVVWCGGNELTGADGLPAGGTEPVLTALRGVVAELDPDRVWLPTSPAHGGGDVHGPWEHQGPAAQWALYDAATSSLHSEFGVEGMSNLATIETYLAEPDRWPADRTNPHVVHRGDFWVNTPLLEDVFGPFDDLASLVAASQLLQADGLRYAVEANRRRQWSNGGSIPWQLADPFPNVFCTSAVDYAGRPKPAYHAVAAAYAALLVSARLPTQVWAGRDHFEADVWVSSRAEHLPGGRVTAALRGPDGSVLHQAALAVDVPAGGSAPVGAIHCPLPGVELFWLDLGLEDRTGMHRSHNRYLCARGADLRAMRDLEAPRLDARWAVPGSRIAIRNVGPRVAVGVRAFDGRPADAPGYAWFDGGYCTLFGGEETTIDVGWTGLPADRGKFAVDAWNSEAPIHV